MNNITLAVPANARILHDGDTRASSTMWEDLLTHVARHSRGIHMVYGKGGTGVPFVVESLEKAAMAAGHKVASQDIELVNPSNWRRAVKLSQSHVVIVRVTAESTEALRTKYHALLKVATSDLLQLRSHVFVKGASPKMSEPILNELELFEHHGHPALDIAPLALR